LNQSARRANSAYATRSEFGLIFADAGKTFPAQANKYAVSFQRSAFGKNGIASPKNGSQ